jgi:CheY-like chemotaxis protein
MASLGWDQIMGKYVVIAEDDPDIAYVVTDVLESEGYEVRTAMGAAALALIEERRPDVALLDYQMPGMDGVTLAGRLRSRPETSTIPIVAMTAATRAPNVCKLMGADACIGKPFDVDQLLAVVSGLVHTTH